MRLFVKNILQALLVFLLVLELVFRYLLPAPELPNFEFDTAYKVLRYEPNTEGDYSVGKFTKSKFHWTINNSGWNNPEDYHPEAKGKKRIAVIGDSFIESLLTNSSETYPMLLANLLGTDTEVYTFGISGAQLSQYLQMARYVEKEFHPDIIILNIVHDDYDESIYGYYEKRRFLTFKIAKDSNKLIEILPESYKTSRLKKTLKHSALLRYLVNDLKIHLVFSGRDDIDQQALNGIVDPALIESRKREIEIVTDHVLDCFVNEFPETRILFVADGPREDIYAGSLGSSTIRFLNDMLANSCATKGLECLDLTEFQDSVYRKNHVPFNSDYDYHWDAYGHKMIAHYVYTYLLNNDGSNAP